MTLRKKLAIGIFVLGVLASVLIVPMTICYRLGFRGTTSPDTYCEYQGYYSVFEMPTKPYSNKTQIRIDHGRVFMVWAALVVFCVLLGTEYKSRQK